MGNLMSRKRYTYRANHIGRLRIRAAAILRANFPTWDVRPEDITPATGSWRTDIRLDVYRWELFSRTLSGYPIVCGCWDTLTKFVREAAKHGCYVTKDDIIYYGKDDDTCKTSTAKSCPRKK